MCNYILIKWKTNSAEFDVLTAVVMKNTIFWDIMPCSPLKVSLQPCRLWVSCSDDVTLNMGRCVSPKRRLTFHGPHGVIVHKMVLFKTDSNVQYQTSVFSQQRSIIYSYVIIEDSPCYQSIRLHKPLSGM
jgi:hypothetical protein